MPEHEIYNLFIGESPIPPAFSQAEIGLIRLQLLEGYQERTEELSRRKTVVREGGVTVEIKEERVGSWIPTASVSWDDKRGTEKSILCDEAAEDGGLWDLCELLTFLTGRRVTWKERTERYDPNPVGDQACHLIETLPACRVCWEKRDQLVEKRAQYALLSYNEGLNTKVLQCMAYYFNCSLNIILDRLVDSPEDVNKGVRAAIKKDVTELIHAREDLSPAQKTAYSALLSSRVDQGTFSAVGQLAALLQELEIIPSSPPETVLRRVKYINGARNLLIHGGRLPSLSGLSQEVSRRYTMVIVAGVVPELCRLVLGRKLGLRQGSLGSLSQNSHDLSTFFNEGNWRGWKLEDRTFEEYFYE